MNKKLTKSNIEKYVTLLQNGDERGLNFFYHRFYKYLLTRTYCTTKDDCAAESIVQEALFRLWLCRKDVKNVDDVLIFLKAQIKSAIQVFFNKSQNRFHRSLLRLDDIENYQEFMLREDNLEEDNDHIVYLQSLEQEKQELLQVVHSMLTRLDDKQQLFIRLCLQYSFNYERIAYYLGGISDYEVGIQVEKSIHTLRSIFQSREKLMAISHSNVMLDSGELSIQQEEIFHMRYELNLSFDQISDRLKLSSHMVKKLFVESHMKLKSISKTA